MDTLTGNNRPSDRNSMTPSPSKNLQSKNYSQNFDGKAFADFIQGSSYKINPEMFTLVSNLDPIEISDFEFMNAARQFNDEDFIRAIYKAYLNREPGNSEVNFWANEIKINKGDRIILPIAIRKTVDFTLLSKLKQKQKKSDFSSKLLGNFFDICVKKIRKFFGIQSLEILISLNQVLEQNEFIMAGFIDGPKTGDKINTSTYTIAGWLIWKNIQPTIRLISNETVIDEVSIQVPRPDVTTAYCLESKTHNWGFKILLNVKELSEQGHLQLQANFPNGQVVNFGLIKFVKY